MPALPDLETHVKALKERVRGEPEKLLLER
jgi:hypothetical protein